MAFVQVNCPNCCAPLEVDSHSSSAKCLYCKSTYIPHPETVSTARSGAAAERTAAELALPRLLEEKDRVANQLAAIKHQWENLRSEAVRLRSAEMDRYKQTHPEWIKPYTVMYKVCVRSAGLFIVFAILSGWVGLWFIAAFLLAMGALAYSRLLELQKFKAPVFPPLPERVQSHDEILLAQRLASITAEIASHRAFLEASRPSYR